MSFRRYERPIVRGAAVALALLACGAAGAGTLPHRVPGVTPRGSRPAAPAFDRRTLLVRFAQPRTAAAAVRSAGDVAAGSVGPAELVRLQPGESVARKVAEYRARPDVAYAEPNAIVRGAGLSAPDDPSFPAQWALAQIHAVAGWNVFPGSYAPTAMPKIAVVDTGIDSTHEDLAAGIDTADAASCINLLDTCVKARALDNDPFGHGTHVAGIAGALADNATGIAGLAFASPLIPVKVLHADETGTVAAVASGIGWAAAHGARVINLSLSTTAFSATLCDAVTAATADGALVVAAAGNAGGGLGTAVPNYPAACPGAVGVAMTDRGDVSPAISNIGFPNVFVSAPGVDIVSTLRFGTYGSFTGTSASAAFVSGLAALLFAQHPERTVADVKRILARTSAKAGGVVYGADPFATCPSCTWHPWFGYGRIDALAALTGPPPVVSSLTPASAPVGAAVTIDGEDFTAATAVDFGGVTSPFTVVSATELTTTVPPGVVVGKVRVTTPGGTGSSAAAFGPQPTLAPGHGRSGAVVTLSGPHIGDATAVQANGASLGFAALSPTVLVARIGDDVADGPLTVTTPEGPYTTSSLVIDPTVARFAPGSGPAGTVLDVGGKSLGAAQSVTIGGVAAAFTVLGPGALQVTVPDAAVTGKIRVTTVGGGVGETAASFVVTGSSALSSAKGDTRYGGSATNGGKR